jgi:hypothetical protein
VILWIIDNPANAVMVHGTWLEACSPAYMSFYETAIRAEMARLSTHATVVMTTAVYPRYLFAREDPFTDCDNAVRRKVARETGTRLIDLNAYVCPTPNCRKTVNGVTLRQDGEHFDGPGGQLIARWLLRQLP